MCGKWITEQRHKKIVLHQPILFKSVAPKKKFSSNLSWWNQDGEIKFIPIPHVYSSLPPMSSSRRRCLWFDSSPAKTFLCSSSSNEISVYDGIDTPNSNVLFCTPCVCENASFNFLVPIFLKFLYFLKLKLLSLSFWVIENGVWKLCNG